MAQIIMVGEMVDPFFKFIESKVNPEWSAGPQAQEQSERISKSLKIKPRFVVTDPDLAGADLLSFAIDIIKDIGVEVFAGLIVDFCSKFFKSEGHNKSSDKKLKIKLKGAVEEIDITNYDLKEVTNLLMKMRQSTTTA